jgi:hypothetical protein
MKCVGCFLGFCRSWFGLYRSVSCVLLCSVQVDVGMGAGSGRWVGVGVAESGSGSGSGWLIWTSKLVSRGFMVGAGSDCYGAVVCLAGRDNNLLEVLRGWALEGSLGGGGLCWPRDGGWRKARPPEGTSSIRNWAAPRCWPNPQGWSPGFVPYQHGPT